MVDTTTSTVMYQVETSMGWVDAGNKWQAFQSQGRNVRALYAAPLDKEASKPAADSQEEKRCEYCDGTGDVHGIDGEWRGECTACKPNVASPSDYPGLAAASAQTMVREVAFHGCEPSGFAADCNTHTYAVQGLGVVVLASNFNALLSKLATPPSPDAREAVGGVRLSAEQLADIRRAAVVIRENSYPCPDKPHSNWALAERIDALLREAGSGK